MHRLLSTLLLTLLALSTPVRAGSDDVRALSFVISYQGLLSAGVPLDIAVARLTLTSIDADDGHPASRLTLEASTAPYPSAELLYPVRYCYRSLMERDFNATLSAEWWNHTAGKQTRGELTFDRTAGLARSYEVAYKTGKQPRRQSVYDESAAAARPLDKEKTQRPLPGGTQPLDRLGMMAWLRQQSLAKGAEFRPAVSNGRQLTGYRIRVEDEEALDWNGTTRPAWRIRLEPEVDDGSETRASWLWMSRDKKRLPLLLRISRAFGSLEMRLLPKTAGGGSECSVHFERRTVSGG